MTLPFSEWVEVNITTRSGRGIYFTLLVSWFVAVVVVFGVH